MRGRPGQKAALERTLKALKLRPEHAVLVGYCRGLAAALDVHPERATLWREYRPAIELLLQVGEASANDGETAFLRSVSTPVGYTASA